MSTRKFLNILLTCLISAGCVAEQVVQTPEEAATLEALKQDEADAKAAIAAAEAELAQAEASGDSASIEAARVKLLAAKGALQAAMQALVDFEAQLLRDRYGTWVAMLSSVPVVGPWVVALGPLAGGLVPLLGKRGRRHYKNAIKNLNPWTPPAGNSSATNNYVAPVAALQDILRAWGVLHSSKGSESSAAAETA